MILASEIAAQNHLDNTIQTMDDNYMQYLPNYAQHDSAKAGLGQADDDCTYHFLVVTVVTVAPRARF